MTFNELFKTILSGSEDQSHDAARKVRKFLYSGKNGDKNKFKQIKNIINTAPDAYAKIAEDWRMRRHSPFIRYIQRGASHFIGLRSCLRLRLVLPRVI